MRTETPSPRTGCFALLCSLRAFQGSGARSATPTGASSRRHTGLTLPALATTLGVLALTSAPAQAKLAHAYSSSFSDSGAMSHPTGVAVNETTGDVYVVDQGRDRVEEFNSTGSKLEGEFDGASGSGTGTLTWDGSATGMLTLLVEGSGHIGRPGQNEVTQVETTAGTFEIGQEIVGTAIPAGTTITGVGAETLTLSNDFEPNELVEVPLTVGSKTVTGLSSTVGFADGEEIGGVGVQAGTTITGVDAGAGTLELSKGPTRAGSGVALTAGSVEITSVVAAAGAFSVGEAIEGVGIEPGTTITAVDPLGRTITLSQLPSASGELVQLKAEQRFDEPQGIAVDNCTNGLTKEPCTTLEDPSAGDVYVTDVGHNVVDKFTASGTYVGQITTGAGGAPLHGLHGVAVDPNGEVWVYREYEREFEKSRAGYGLEIYNYTDALVNAFVSAHEFQPNTPAQEGDLAVDSEDHLYAIDGSGSSPVVEKLNSSGAEEAEAFGGVRGASGIAVDPSNNDVYIDENGVVQGLSASGSLIETFGSEHLTEEDFQKEEKNTGVAVNYSSGSVYVANDAGNDVVVFGLAVAPDVAVEPVSGFLSDTSVMLKGTVDPEGIPVTACEFEYVTESESREKGGFRAPGVKSVPCVHPDAGELPADSGVHAVSAVATGLKPGEAYYYRLSASDAQATANNDEGNFFLPYTVAIEGESTSFVESKAVVLEAKINPGGAETSYYFEYGPSARSYDVRVPVPAHELAASLAGVRVGVRAMGLQPGTTYHYRVVASNGLPGAVDGPDQTFTTLVPQGTGSPANCPNEQARAEQPYGLGLPDCRAYEQVTPVDKEGAGIEEDLGPEYAAFSGEAFVSASESAFGEPAGSLLVSVYLSRRGPDGWSTQDISPPVELSSADNLEEWYKEGLFTPELTKGVLLMPESSLSPEVSARGYNDLYVVDFAERSYELVNNIFPPPEGHRYDPIDAYLHPAGASVDLSHVVYTESEEEHGSEIYKMYVWVDGHVHQVNIAPTGTVFTGNSPGQGWHAVSEGGLLVFFTESAEVDSANVGRQLFVRENPEQAPYGGSECAVAGDACTVDVSASQRTNAKGESEPDPHGPQPAKYEGASANGSRVFFTSNAELTDNAKTGPEDNAANLYEYDLEAPEGHRLTDLTVDTTDANGAQVEGVAGRGDIGGISEEGSYVYFYAKGRLAGNENGHGASAVAGERNLYVYHDGVVSFIATPNGEEEVRLSADGTHIAFISEASLTGYDNHPLEPHEGCGSDGCEEIYLYDATTGTLVCASCNPGGEPPVGGARFGPSLLEGRSDFRMPHNLSADGGRLFFESDDPLLPLDSNGLGNVYEYENGHLYSISDGAGSYASSFDDASVSGNDVFFLTTDGLLPQDRDQRGDVYDARVGGGFPVAAAAPKCNNADSCHGPQSPQPGVFGAPSSATFSGPGSSTPEVAPPPKKVVTKKTVKCRKGYVKKKVKKKEQCVKVKSKKAKKSTHGKGSK